MGLEWVLGVKVYLTTIRLKGKNIHMRRSKGCNSAMYFGLSPGSGLANVM